MRRSRFRVQVRNEAVTGRYAAPSSELENPDKGVICRQVPRRRTKGRGSPMVRRRRGEGVDRPWDVGISPPEDRVKEGVWSNHSDGS